MPGGPVERTDIRLHQTLTTVTVLPAGSEVLSVVPHGKTGVCNLSRVFPVLMMGATSGLLGFELTLKWMAEKKDISSRRALSCSNLAARLC